MIKYCQLFMLMFTVPSILYITGPAPIDSVDAVAFVAGLPDCEFNKVNAAACTGDPCSKNYQEALTQPGAKNKLVTVSADVCAPGATGSGQEGCDEIEDGGIAEYVQAPTGCNQIGANPND